LFKRFKKYSDEEIVAHIKSAQSGDVLKYLYKSIEPQIRSWILKNKGNIDDAQDIFQDAVLSFYNYVLDDKFENGKSVGAFIFTTAKNLWVNRAKQLLKISSELPLHLKEDSKESRASKENEEKISSLLAQLGERCEELLTYSIFYKMSMEDIAIRMGFSGADAAKTKNYKCKQRLVVLVKSKQNLKDYLFSE